MRAGWLLLLLVCGCSGEPSIAPGGIVSNNPCIDSILAEIAAPGQVSAVSSYSHNADGGSAPLGWARSLPAVGMGAEDIIAAQPRLVLTGNLASSGTNAALARAGVKTINMGVAATFAEDVAQVRMVAKAIGRNEAGERLVGEMEAAVRHSGLEGKIGSPSAIIWQNGGFVAGEGTLQDELLRHHGFTNASAAYGLKSWDILPIEVLARNPPDIIFMPQSAKGSDRRALDARRKMVLHLDDKVRIVDFPDKLLFCTGPTTIKVARILANAREAMQ